MALLKKQCCTSLGGFKMSVQLHLTACVYVCVCDHTALQCRGKSQDITTQNYPSLPRTGHSATHDVIITNVTI